MKRKFKAAMIAAMLGIYGMFAMTSAPQVEAAPAKVLKGTPIEVTGEARADSPDAKNKALLNAKKRAVRKALQQIGVTPSKEVNSRFVLLTNNCESYISDAIKIISTKRFGDKQLVFCTIPVDMQKLNADADKLSTLAQKKEFGDKPIFLIRVKGITDLEQNKTIPNNVQNIYAHEFRNQGFSVGASELSSEWDIGTQNVIASKKNEDLPYETYKEAMKEIVKPHLVIPIIVVGEICITKTMTYADSGYAEAAGHFDVWVRNEDNSLQEISCINDYYNASRVNVKEAVNVVSRTVALNSAQRLADATYNFWIKR